MTIQIIPLGGYNEVGRNCTAVKVDDEIVILDMGLHIPKYIEVTEEEDIKLISSFDLAKVGAIPDIEPIEKFKKQVICIVTTHAHYDHIGAIPFLAKKFSSPIICTPFTKAVINAILDDNKMKIKNQIIAINQNSSYRISKNVTIEFVAITHSTPQTVLVIIHTVYGAICYANDFKLDNSPTLGKPPNYKRLKKLARENVLLLIVNALYASLPTKTPSEAIAKQMLTDVMSSIKDNNLIVFTTFASHIARLKTIIHLSKKTKRKIVIMGRSMSKYIKAAQSIGLVNFSKYAEILRYQNQYKKIFKKIQENPSNYILIVTGNQAEPDSILTKMTYGKFNFKFLKNDAVIFSCKTIPVEQNLNNRNLLEKELKNQGVRIFSDVHVSGHAAREDLRELIDLIKPKNIIPIHYPTKDISSFVELAEETGYKKGQNIFIIKNGQILNLNSI